MSGIFNLENPFWQFMSKVGDIILLNILWLVCCIPIITIGPSTTALYYVMLKRVRDEEGNVTQQFFRSFKQNFKQGTIIGLIMTVCGLLFGFDIMFYRDAQGEISTVLWWLSMVMFILYLMVLTYIFPMLAKFENTIKNYFIFSVYLSIRHFGQTVLMILILAAMVLVMFYIYPPLILLFMGVTAYLDSKMLVKIFDRYIPEDKKKAAAGYDQGFDQLEEAAAAETEEPVHIVLDIDNPEHVVLGDVDSLADRKNPDEKKKK